MDIDIKIKPTISYLKEKLSAKVSAKDANIIKFIRFAISHNKDIPAQTQDLESVMSAEIKYKNTTATYINTYNKYGTFIQAAMKYFYYCTVSHKIANRFCDVIQYELNTTLYVEENINRLDKLQNNEVLDTVRKSLYELSIFTQVDDIDFYKTLGLHYVDLVASIADCILYNAFVDEFAAYFNLYADKDKKVNLLEFNKFDVHFYLLVLDNVNTLISSTKKSLNNYYKTDVVKNQIIDNLFKTIDIKGIHPNEDTMKRLKKYVANLNIKEILQLRNEILNKLKVEYTYIFNVNITEDLKCK